MNILSRAQVERIRQQYPPETEVELITMPNDPYPVPPGTRGKVVMVDDVGQLVTKWSNGSSKAGIPHRGTSFCSYWDYTMLHRFRDYDEDPDSNRNILKFRAFGENRDGLAIRTVCDVLMQREEENKILILLSDGRPNHLGVARPGCRKITAYVGEDAVKDTALEVRKARNQGISVLGIFVGSEEDLYAEKKIFGKEFAYTRNIGSFAHIVGTYLRRQMEQD